MDNQLLQSCMMWMGGIFLFLISMKFPRLIIPLAFGFVLTQYADWSAWSWVMWGFLAFLGLCIDVTMKMVDDDDDDDAEEMLNQIN